MIKKNNKLVLIVSLITLVLLMNTGCKDFGVPEYNFTVIHGDGIGGLPAAGSYSYKELTSINYEYIFIDDSERSPHVFVNDGSAPLASLGTIIMYRDIEIFVGDVDIRGNWKLTVIDANENKTESNVVFSGTEILEGTFTDDIGYQGIWTSINNIVTMTYSNRTAYKLAGSVSPGYLYGTVYIDEIGSDSWSMVKDLD